MFVKEASVNENRGQVEEVQKSEKESQAKEVKNKRRRGGEGE